MSGMTSLLEAVNRVLALTGEEPVNSLDTDFPQVSIVLNIITNQSRQIQQKGWWFNEESKIKLIPNIEKRIVLPENVLNCSIINDNGNFIQRGDTIFNKLGQTYEFEHPLCADIVRFLEWTELPQIAREYVIAQARLNYNQDFFNDQNLKQDLYMESQKLWIELREKHINNLDLNVLKNVSIRETLRRR